MKEVTFLVRKAEEGEYFAEAAGFGIFAEGETIEELRENIKGGIDCFFDKEELSSFAHLHFVKDEILASRERQEIFPARTLLKL